MLPVCCSDKWSCHGLSGPSERSRTFQAAEFLNAELNSVGFFFFSLLCNRLFSLLPEMSFFEQGTQGGRELAGAERVNFDLKG